VTLVELMVALVLGLVVAGSALALFLTNRQTHAAGESLARVQESARIAFELMARELREADSLPCLSSSSGVGSVLNGQVPFTDASWSTSGWWRAWGGGVRGYAAGTIGDADAIELKATVPLGITLTADQGAWDAVSDAALTVSSTAAIDGNDILVVCDFGRPDLVDGGGTVLTDKRVEQATMFQVSAVASGTSIAHSDAGAAPGNCADTFGDCNPVIGAYLSYVANGEVGRLRATQWFVDENGRGSSSLYRRSLRNVEGVVRLVDEEIAEGVTDMEIMYLAGNNDSYVNAASIGATEEAWAAVRAVRVALTLEDEGLLGPDGEPLRRTLEHVVAIRSRSS